MEGKAIRIHNFYADLNNTESLDNTETNEHDNDHIMIKLQLQGQHGPVKVNTMVDSGATEDFIDQGLCHKYGIRTTRIESPRMIYLADGKQSDMGPVTHIAKVPMKIGSHHEQATFQVANLNNHEAVLGMPWLREHSPTINWANHKVTFSSERCTTWCLKESPMVYTIPEAEAREENLHMQYSQVHIKHSQTIRVQKLKRDATLPSKGSTKAAGHDLFAYEDTRIPANRQKTIGTGIAVGLPDGTYGRIAPQSGLAVKHHLHVMAGVIDGDYTGEV